MIGRIGAIGRMIGRVGAASPVKGGGVPTNALTSAINGAVLTSAINGQTLTSARSN